MPMSKPNYLKTRIFLDSGNPEDTKQAQITLGFLDGQTTNPSLVMKNPHIQELKTKGELNVNNIWKDYQEVAETIKSVIPGGSVSVEVYADNATTEEVMYVQAKELSSWFPGVFVKVPATTVGLKVAEKLVSEGINVNVTLCFSQEQAAAVHMATKNGKGLVYVSPFIGRLDDVGQNGIDLIDNIVRMYKEWGSHVAVLGASIRNLDHMFGCFQRNADIVTIPFSIIQSWKEYGFEKNPQEHIQTISDLTPIAYKSLQEENWELYDIKHSLTDKGIEKFVADWKSLLS